QSGTDKPEPVDVTMAPAKIRNKVRTATIFAKSRSHAGVGATEIIRGLYTSTSRLCRSLRFHPLHELVVCIDKELPAHPVMAQTAELGAGDFPRRAVVRLDRGEVNRNVHPGDRILLHAHDGKEEAVNHIFGGDVNDHRPVLL